MADLLTSPVRFLRTLWHQIVGRFSFRLRWSSRARRHFEQVLALKGDDFAAYFYLARIAYSAGDTVGYQRELENARRTSPEKMARIRYLFDYFEPSSSDATVFEESGERATWRAFRMSSVGGSNPDPDESPGGGCRGGGLRRYGDDFSSQTERERFAELPAIRSEDVASVDVDRLSEAL